ncbi:cytosine deaminase [Anoxybacterium hadale]|uniref:Cytosine deaminase n=1 Tax=Anoxybacterium hadale TaxID=3408580 RepID=A0ACD1AFA3_9FIRM|nr:cytosine deaminase [Clostridiales bacterium]
MNSLFIKNAKLRGQEGLSCILIEDGSISRIGEGIAVDGLETVDAGGNLVVPPFVDPHVHLDAVLSAGDLSRPNKSGTLLEAIDIWGERKPFLTKEILKQNAREVVNWYIANGVLRVRTHADCSDPTLVTVESLVELRDEVRDLIDIQVVAFPQDGIFTKPDGEALLRKALEIGADVVGGAPHIEYTREDGVRDVETVYRLAEEFDRLIDIHIDETGDPHSRFVEVMAKENINRGWQGRAAASHTTAMHNYNNDYAFKLLGILKKADMNMITNPFDNSVLQNRTDGYPRKRGHTRVDELLARGVNVCIGHDSIMDPWYSMGKGNMIAAANLLAHTAHMNGHDQITTLMDMITVRSARTLKIEDTYGLETGKPADLVILDARDDAEAVRLTSECLYVIRRGKIISKTEPAVRTLFVKETPETVDFKLGKR